MRWKTMTAAGALVLSIGTPAFAGVIFSNFGDNDAIDGGNGWTLSRGEPVGIDFDSAEAFTVTGGNHALEAVELAASLIAGGNALTVSVHNDSSGAPGSLLEAVTVTDQMGLFGEAMPPILAAFSGETVLEDGLQYWVVAATDDDSWAAWHLNSIDAFGPHGVQRDAGPWETAPNRQGAFRVTGQAMPAPGAMAFLLAGALVGRRRRRG